MGVSVGHQPGPERTRALLEKIAGGEAGRRLRAQFARWNTDATPEQIEDAFPGGVRPRGALVPRPDGGRGLQLASHHDTPRDLASASPLRTRTRRGRLSRRARGRRALRTPGGRYGDSTGGARRARARDERCRWPVVACDVLSVPVPSFSRNNRDTGQTRLNPKFAAACLGSSNPDRPARRPRTGTARSSPRRIACAPAVTLKDECDPAIRAVSAQTSGRLSPTSRCLPGRDCRRVESRRSQCSCSSDAAAWSTLQIERRSGRRSPRYRAGFVRLQTPRGGNDGRGSGGFRGRLQPNLRRHTDVT
jgi:hypothetical protein